MIKKFLHFLQYHNLSNVAFVGIFVVGAGTIFAATDEGVRQAVVDSVVKETKIITQVDNSVIVNTNLDNFNAVVQILEVKEDDFAYYVTYQFTTLEVQEGRWKEVKKTNKMTVDKEVLAGRDLGLYLAEELKELIKQELRYLKEVQEIERKKGEKRKTVAIQYSGLIGKLFDTKEETFDGYDVVVEEPEKIIARHVPDIAPEQISEQIIVQKQPELNTDIDPTPNPDSTLDSTTDITAPVITLSEGEAQITLELNETYTEQTATAVDETDGTVDVIISGNVDTAIAGTYTIIYTATDVAGNESIKSREVIVNLEVNGEVLESGETPDPIPESTPDPATELVTEPTADTIAPVITLTGDTNIIISVGDTYIDAGATALDETDGDITANITTTGLPIDNNTVGNQTIEYTVVDAVGNTTTIERIIIVEAISDITAPTITLSVGEDQIILELNATYIEQTATAYDKIDGIIDVVISGSVNTVVAGTYTITYTATDAAGNVSTKSREVVVNYAPTFESDPALDTIN